MKRTLLALTLLAALPFAASAAEGVSYNYVQGGYVATDADGGLDADGYGIDGSVAIHDNFHLFGGFSQQEIDDTNVDVDQWRLGVGYNYGLGDKADLVTRVAYEKFDAGSGFDFDGYSAEVGVRGAMAKNFEGYVFAGYEDYEDFDGDFYGRVGATVKFNDNWSLNGDVKISDDTTQWFIGPRFTW
jgi:Ax21 family sulfation-dependent quorum factor